MAREIPWARRNPKFEGQRVPSNVGQRVPLNIDRENRIVAHSCINCGRLLCVALREFTWMCQRCAEEYRYGRAGLFRVNHIPHEDIIK